MKDRPTSFEELPLVLTIEELAPLLNVGRNTVYELVRNGQIKSIKIGSQHRILKQETPLPSGENSPDPHEENFTPSCKISHDPHEISRTCIISRKDIPEHIPPLPPTGGKRGGRKKDKSVPSWKPERFEAFWEYYRTHARGEDRQDRDPPHADETEAFPGLGHFLR